MQDRFPAKKKARAVFVDLTAAYNTAWHWASHVSCSNCYLTDTWSTFSWRWLAIAASPLPPEKRKEAGYHQR